MTTRHAVPAAGSQRPDASMSLLTDLMTAPGDEEYVVAAERRRSAGLPPRQRTWVSGLVLLVAGLLLAAAAVQWRSSQSGLQAERAGLTARIQAETAQLDALEREARELQRDIAALRDAQLASAELGERRRERLARLGAATGADPATGPGLRIIVDDAEPAADSATAPDEGRVLDADLQRLVNGLWAAGAEAVSVDGQRLTAATPIRSANDAILVGFRPIDPPYEVLAIGDLRTLEARLASGPAGEWFDTLRRVYGIGYSVEPVEELQLPAALVLAEPRHAEVMGEETS